MMEKNIVFPKCIPSIASARHVDCRFHKPAEILSPAVKKRLLKVRKFKNKYFPNEFFGMTCFFGQAECNFDKRPEIFSQKVRKKFPTRIEI